MIRLVIEKMSKGGFVVGELADFQQNVGGGPLFACTDIADALGFIGDNMAPVETACSETVDKCGCVQCVAAREWLVSAHAASLRDRLMNAESPLLPTGRYPCSVCGSLHAESYCARQTCPRRPPGKLYEPAADGSVNWAG